MLRRTPPSIEGRPRFNVGAFRLQAVRHLLQVTVGLVLNPTDEGYLSACSKARNADRYIGLNKNQADRTPATARSKL